MNPTIRRALWPTVTMLAGAWAGDIVCAHVRARLAAGDDANRIINTWTAAFRNPTPSLDQTDLACGLIIAAMIGLAWLYHWARKGNYRTGEEYGSARWATPRDMAPYTDPDPSHNLQMTATEGISIDTHTTGRNTNVTAIGSSGSGKSHYYVLPNLLANHNLNWAVTDPKGELHDTARASLEANGYQVKLLDLANLSEASHFNPLAYIDPDQPDTAIMRLVTNIMDNTEQAGARTQQSGNDGFWTKAERSLLTALTALVYHTDDHPNLNKVADLALKMEASEEDETMRSDVDILMECAEQLADQVQAHPQEWDEEARATAEGLRFAISQYRPFTQGAGETKKSVIISLGVRLAPMQVGAVRHILESDDIGIDQYTQGDRIAIFLGLSDEDPTFNFIAAMFYQCLFDRLMRATRTLPGQTLPRPLHCMLDEFANVGRIPSFERLIATIRSRGISASIIIQNLAQLKTMYKDGWETILGNCDSILFLGGNEQSTTEWISKRLGKATIDTKDHSESKGRSGSTTTNYRRIGRELMTPDELGHLDNRECIYMLRGLNPFKSRKNTPDKPVRRPHSALRRATNN